MSKFERYILLDDSFNKVNMTSYFSFVVLNCVLMYMFNTCHVINFVCVIIRKTSLVLALFFMNKKEKSHALSFAYQRVAFNIRVLICKIFLVE